MSEDVINIPDNFPDPLCKGMTVQQVRDRDICSSGCPAIVDCMHYAVNNNIDHYMANMSSEQRKEWVSKSILSGESPGNITYRRCYQHLKFLEKHGDRSKILSHTYVHHSSYADYESISFDAECRLQDQSEPKIDDVKSLPAKYDDLGWHDPHDEIVYDVNSYKYVGSDFVEDPDILVIGGSESITIGIPQDFTWHRMIEKEKSFSVNNMSVPSGQMNSISRNFLFHLENFGAPKFLIITISNLDTYVHPTEVEDKTSRKIFYANPYIWNYSDNLMDISNSKDISFKKEIFDYNYLYKAVYDSMSDLYFINSICKILNINLICVFLNELWYNVIKNRGILENLFYFDKDLILDKKCHTENVNYGKEFWNKNILKQDLGIHSHIHIYEEIRSIIEKFS